MSRAAAHAQPLEVPPRWLLHVGLMLALAVAMAAIVSIRRDDLDAEDAMLTALLLAGCFWIFALALGSLVRSLSAGYALRLDHAGLHVPGLDPIPWHAVQGARLHAYRSKGVRFRQLVVDVAPGYSGASPRHYERYLFGPVPGLVGPRGTVAIPMLLLAIDGESLLAAVQGFRAGVDGRAQAPHVGRSAREGNLSGRRLP